MSGIVLSLKSTLQLPVDASALALHTFADLTEGAIGALGLRVGRESIPVGDIFSIRGDRSSNIRVEGAVELIGGLGSRLAVGELVIDGDAGDHVGAGMTGGRIRVHGRVGDAAGVAMRGGILEIDGDAGDRVGGAPPGARRGMTGGEIVVHGSVGREAGMRARRGLVAVRGGAGPDLARDIIAGTMVVFGRTGERPGLGCKRGSIVALGGIDVPRTYRLACTLESAFVRLILTHLHRRFAMPVDDRLVAGRFRRYCGDAGVPGKGEILEWTPA